MPERFDTNKETLDVFKAKPGTERFKEELLKLAKAGITHSNFDMVKIVKGEFELERSFRPDPAHDYLHTLRVLKIAENFSDIGQDRDVLYAAGVFHDLITHIKGSSKPEEESERTVEYVRDLLTSMPFPEYKIPKVLEAIRKSTAAAVFETQGRPENIEAFILYTADKIDQSGAMMAMRYLASGGHRGRQLYNRADPTAQTVREMEEYKYTVDALLTRMPMIEKNMWYRAARDTIEKRNDFVFDFIKELQYELKEEKDNRGKKWVDQGGAVAIIKAFEKSGREALAFYNPDDPFAVKRQLQPKRQPLDQVMAELRFLQDPKNTKGWPKKATERRKKFLIQFLDELKFELSGEFVLPEELKIKPENPEFNQ